MSAILAILVGLIGGAFFFAIVGVFGFAAAVGALILFILLALATIWEASRS